MIAGLIANKLFQTILPYLLGGMVITVMGLSFTVWYLKGQYQDLLVESADKLALSKSNTERLEGVVKRQKLVITTLRGDKRFADELTDKRNQDLAETRKILNEVRNENNSYKEKWTSKLGKKFTLLTRIVNRATLKRVRRFEALTCRSDCGGDPDNQSSNETGTETGHDPANPLQ